VNREERQKRVVWLSHLLLEGSASQEEQRELNDLLKGDPEACEWYLETMEADAFLTREFGLEESLPEAPTLIEFPEPTQKQSPQRSQSWWVGVGAAAALLVAALVFPLISNPDPELATTKPDNQKELVDPGGVAVVSRLMRPQWPEDSLGWKEGDSLQTGQFALQSGVAQIDFFSGASVVVEGPAKLELNSLEEVICHEGKLRVSVPETAHGFTIVTADYRAVDLGTEFALSVASSGESQVHVLDGQVRLDDGDGKEIGMLNGGAGGVFPGEGAAYVPAEKGGRNFVSRKQLLTQVKGNDETQFAAWKNSRAALAEDKSLLIHYDFENQNPWDAKVSNRNSRGPAGAVIGARWTEGRWPGKGALEFKRISDRVRLHLPGEHEAVTIIVSLRVEGFDRWLSSIFLTDGFESGELHWQLSDIGELILGMSGGSPKHTLFSKPVIKPQDLGRWLKLALTVDTESGEVFQYLDGARVHKGRYMSLEPIRFGDVEMGNWRSKHSNRSIRSLNGVIDEFLLFDRVLSEEEIRRLSLLK